MIGAVIAVFDKTQDNASVASIASRTCLHDMPCSPGFRTSLANAFGGQDDSLPLALQP
jgi:hypothetical protein